MIAKNALISQALKSGRYALIGAGQLGAMSLAMWPKNVARPELILDSVKTGHLDGIPISSLVDHGGQAGITYLLSAFKLEPSAIRAIFDGIGQSEILTVYDFFQEHTPTLFTNGWRNLEPGEEVLHRLAKLPDFYADDLSREICDAVTAWRYRRELLTEYPVSGEGNKYDLAMFDRGERHYDLVCDGGAYDLGFLAELDKAGVTWSSAVAFEPDPACQSLCAAHATRWEVDGGATVTLDTRALSNQAGTAYFLASGLLSARIIGTGVLNRPDLITVKTCRLDDISRERLGDEIESPKRVLLKLHIEGSELPALEGAHDLLANHSVDIFLNLSHDERSWLDIPEYLASFGLFDIYLRSHALFGEGLTLFARNRA